MGRDAIRGRRAQKACPCPRLLNVHTFGVPTAAYKRTAPRDHCQELGVTARQEP